MDPLRTAVHALSERGGLELGLELGLRETTAEGDRTGSEAIV